jgi:hypothetical protein
LAWSGNVGLHDFHVEPCAALTKLVLALRRVLDMTQKDFAAIFWVSLGGTDAPRLWFFLGGKEGWHCHVRTRPIHRVVQTRGGQYRAAARADGEGRGPDRRGHWSGLDWHHCNFNTTREGKTCRSESAVNWVRSGGRFQTGADLVKVEYIWATVFFTLGFLSLAYLAMKLLSGWA